MIEADALIAELNLAPHPEGGFFRETFRDNAGTGRAASTAIYYLLKAGETSAWHRVDAAEVWHWYAGAPLELHQRTGDEQAITQTLGNNIKTGERPQIVVPPTSGSPPAASAPGLSPAVPSPPASSSPASNWRQGRRVLVGDARIRPPNPRDVVLTKVTIQSDIIGKEQARR